VLAASLELLHAIALRSTVIVGSRAGRRLGVGGGGSGGGGGGG
jgi:hypothetical protein